MPRTISPVRVRKPGNTGRGLAFGGPFALYVRGFGDFFMRLFQYQNGDKRAVAATDGSAARVVNGATSVYALAQGAVDGGRKLGDVIASRGLGAAVDAAAVLADGKMLPPIDHPDPTHLHVTGTGLTHLGSASTRD